MLHKNDIVMKQRRNCVVSTQVSFASVYWVWLVLQEALLITLSFSKPEIASFGKKSNSKHKAETKTRKTKWLDTIARSRSFLRTAICSKWNTRSKPSVKETPPWESAAPTSSSSASRKNPPSSSKTPGRKHTFL